jgi:hypothetical protein
MLSIIMIDNYQIQTKSAESYWIFDVSSATQNVTFEKMFFVFCFFLYVFFSVNRIHFKTNQFLFSCLNVIKRTINFYKRLLTRSVGVFPEHLLD